MASVIQQAKSALRQMGTKFQNLAALAGKDAVGTGKALKTAQNTLNNMAKQAGDQAAAAGALVANSKAGDSHKLVEKAGVAKSEAEKVAGSINSIISDLEGVQSAFNVAKTAANDTASAL